MVDARLYIVALLAMAARSPLAIQQLCISEIQHKLAPKIAQVKCTSSHADMDHMNMGLQPAGQGRISCNTWARMERYSRYSPSQVAVHLHHPRDKQFRKS